MTKEEWIGYKELMTELTRNYHYLEADGLLTLIFVYGYDIDWYPLLTRRIGNW